MAFAGAEKLLDFNQPFDVGMLDRIIGAFYTPGADPAVVRGPFRAETSDPATLASNPFPLTDGKMEKGRERVGIQSPDTPRLSPKFSARRRRRRPRSLAELTGRCLREVGHWARRLAALAASTERVRSHSTTPRLNPKHECFFIPAGHQSP